VSSDAGLELLASGQHPVLRPPLVLQQYVAHGPHLYKVSTQVTCAHQTKHFAFTTTMPSLPCPACCCVGYMVAWCWLLLAWRHTPGDCVVLAVCRPHEPL
jgi:hypothetical protein